MTASLDSIQRILEQIRNDLPLLIQNSQITPVQIVTGEGLSDISRRLGLIQAGEFRAGNGVEPGLGFTGGRYGYPGFAYGNDIYFLAGIENDVLQVGLSLTDGRIVFGGGDGWLDQWGLTFANQEGLIQFLDTEDGGTMALYADGGNFLVIENSYGGTGISFLIDDASHTLIEHTFGANLIEFNVGLGNVDFRYKGVGDGDLVFFDADADRVGIGTATPNHKLDVNGAINIATGNKYKINGVNIKAPYTYATHLNFATVPAGSVAWASPPTGSTASEAGQLVLRAGTAKNFYVRTATAQPGTGVMHIILRKNGVDTSLVIVVPAGGAGGNYSDTTNTVALAAGDRIAFRLVNFAGSASAQIAPLAVEVEFDVV